jgi:hypothetical protein
MLTNYEFNTNIFKDSEYTNIYKSTNDTNVYTCFFYTQIDICMFRIIRIFVAICTFGVFTIFLEPIS